MRFFTISLVMSSLSIGVLAAPDLSIVFPVFLRVRQNGVVNLQSFASALVSVPADPITITADPKKPFEVAGSTFSDFRSAVTRSCSIQKNACAEIANSKDGRNTAGIRVGNCDDQQGKSLLFSCLLKEQCNLVADAGLPAGAVLPSSTSSILVPEPTLAVSVSAAQVTLHSSDERFLYFCDV
ncbi:hypothetical protein WAI453_011663 [Rhynchosporium graminicola]